jgi:hypothetical protein
MSEGRLEAFRGAVIAVGLHVLVALPWLVPDRRIESMASR